MNYEELFKNVKTPSYIVSEELVENNMKTIKSVIDATGCKILLAQKGFSMFSMYPLMKKYLSGTTASSLHEARLGYEEFGLETHIYNPAYQKQEIREILTYVDHIVFNSFEQLKKYYSYVKEAEQVRNIHISVGLRINPEFSTGEHDIYDPCREGSRFGVKLSVLEEIIKKDNDALKWVEGFHFHTLCEQNSDDLESTLEVVLKKFGPYMKDMKWINFGGGHHITRSDYDIERLIKCIKSAMDIGLMVYLEPGEATVLNTGFMATRVLEIIEGEKKAAIVDTSAACHMPDIIEMPYTPKLIYGDIAEDENELGKTYESGNCTYILGGPTCLAGDIIGTYSFDKPLNEGDMLIFTDMSHYSMVKNNTFNGINLPDICLLTKDNEIKVIRSFGYEDFKNRLS